MKENTKNTIIQQVCNKGIPFFLISSILNYLAGKVWGFIWSNYTAVFILAIYIMIVLVGIYRFTIEAVPRSGEERIVVLSNYYSCYISYFICMYCRGK